MCMIRDCELLQAARLNERLGGGSGVSARCSLAPSPLEDGGELGEYGLDC